MDVEIRHESFRSIVDPQARMERLAGGFGFAEGPLWDRTRDRVIFSDMKDDHMRVWSAAGGIETYRKPSNKANGNTYDRQGRLVTCEHATSRVVREEKDGSISVLASHLGSKELNSPNDIVVRSDGAIYFSDPSFGRIREDVGLPRPLQLDLRGVYRIPPGGGDVQLLASDFEQPNGLCFSLDQSTLWVNDTVRKHIRRFRVKADGSLEGGEVWAETTGDAVGPPDGMKLDSLGNVYCTGPGGVHVFDPQGRCLGAILTPERATNFAFGDNDCRSLYITGIAALYRMRLLTPGQLTY